MFVVFEGIDGSGKTTVSNLVAKSLRKRGIEIDHIRDGGEFASPLVTRMREFGKNTQNLALRPMPEFLMYVARDAQLLDECIIPILAKGGLVFADRYFYSYEVLGHYGRGLELEQIRAVIDLVAGGVWPDLVVLMDVDPHVARARRRTSKISAPERGVAEPKGGSRKGLGGVGMAHRLRDGYLQRAAQEPERWLVVDNANSDLDMVVNRVTDAIARLYEGAATSRVVAATSVRQRVAPRAEQPTVEAARDAFYEMIAMRSDKEPAVAAYFLSGLEDVAAHRWRVELAASAPAIVAYGLKNLADDGSWELRSQLQEQAPRQVAASLSGLSTDSKQADEIRSALFAKVPRAVLSSLKGRNTEVAWEFREELKDTAPDAVVRSLAGMDCSRSWGFREQAQDIGDNTNIFATQDDRLMATAVISSISGLADARSWTLREQALENYPVQVLGSLSGLECARSWQLREEFVGLAPKVVLRSFDGQTSDSAWTMRKRFGSKAKESLDSMRGLDGEVAWGIRHALIDVWPSTVASSLGELAVTERGMELVRQLLSGSPGNVSLLKHVTKLTAVVDKAHSAGGWMMNAP